MVKLRRSLLPLALAAGCTDPTVTVTVELPDGYPVETLTVRVLVFPPPAEGEDPYTCDSLAFGDVDDDAIDLAVEATVDLVPGDRVAIGGVPREPEKHWLVEGRAGGRVTVAGCVKQEEIEGNAVVTIPAEPTAAIQVTNRPPMDARVPSEPIVVTVDDGALPPRPLADRLVRVRVHGPGDWATWERSDATDGDGEVSFTLEEPPAFGPVSIQFNARWAIDQPVVVPAFRHAATRTLAIADADPCGDQSTVELERWEGFQFGNHRAVAGLVTDGDRQRFYVAGWNGIAPPTQDCTFDQVNLSEAKSFTVVRNDGIQLVALTADQIIVSWVAVGDTNGDGLPEIFFRDSKPFDWTNPDPTPSAPVSIVTMRNCGAVDAEDYVLVQLEDDDFSRVLAFDADRMEIPDHPLATLIESLPDGLRMIRAGCIDQSGEVDAVPAVILESRSVEGDPAPALRYLALDAPTGPTEIAVESTGAVGFTRVNVQEIDEPLFLGAELDPTSVKIVRWRVVETDAGIALHEDSSERALRPPTSLGHDHLDGDTMLDTIWTIDDAIPGGPQELRLEISLGKGADNEPLIGLSPPLAEDPGVGFLDPGEGNENTADLIIARRQHVTFIDTGDPL
jgi:hypothetical protein